MHSELGAFSLDGKNAVVTGAARGIGEATSRQLGQIGAHVVLADLTDAEDDTAGRLKAKGCRRRGPGWM